MSQAVAECLACGELRPSEDMRGMARGFVEHTCTRCGGDDIDVYIPYADDENVAPAIAN